MGAKVQKFKEAIFLDIIKIKQLAVAGNCPQLADGSCLTLATYALLLIIR